MTPDGGGKPSGDLVKLFDRRLEGFDSFKKSFVEAAERRFGSGYVWLVSHGNKLEIIDLPNAEMPLGDARPLLNYDVWEHAYYLDYQHERGKFVKAFLSHLVDWEAVAKRFKDASEDAIRKVA